MSAGWQYFLWGLFGGSLVDGLEFVKVVRARGGTFPKRFFSAGHVASEVVRLLIGGALALVFFESGQVNTPLTAATIGISAPITIERLLLDQSSEQAAVGVRATAKPSAHA
ncbi:MAG: hypothetical protein ABSH22_19060 [Tepidisphaeraceae bacterium]|jgi:hypothetical protein